MPIEFNTVVHRFSDTSGVIPTAAELYPGELALNLVDGKLFTLNLAGQVIDLTYLNTKFNLVGAIVGDLLVYDAVTGRYVTTPAANVFNASSLSFDGGTY
jgi:hypothetical protein